MNATKIEVSQRKPQGGEIEATVITIIPPGQ
jgi:hypothetical protein